MAKMFLMCGHPGSGKTYYAKRFAELNGYRYLSIDDTYAYFNGSPYSHDNKFQVWITFFQQIHAAEIANQDIVVDTNAPTKDDRTEFLNWFPSFDHHLIWINANWEQCFENNNNRKRVIPKTQMYDIFFMFETPEADESLKARSQWHSLSRIDNFNNTFTKMLTYSGLFPSDTKEYIKNG